MIKYIYIIQVIEIIIIRYKCIVNFFKIIDFGVVVYYIGDKVSLDQNVLIYIFQFLVKILVFSSKLFGDFVDLFDGISQLIGGLVDLFGGFVDFGLVVVLGSFFF